MFLAILAPNARVIPFMQIALPLPKTLFSSSSSSLGDWKQRAPCNVYCFHCSNLPREAFNRVDITI